MHLDADVPSGRLRPDSGVVWFPLNRPATPRMRVLCLPYAGGGIATYRAWPQGLSADIEVRAAQLAGRGSRLREPRVSHLTPLLDDLDRAIASLLHLPFALFGHSLGALLAFELTRRLQRQGRPLPVHLFVSGREAPQCESIRPPIHHLPEEDFRSALRDMGGMPPEILDNAELMALVSPVIRADFTAVETWPYVAGPPLDVPLTAFVGDVDREYTLEQAEAWRVHTTRAFTCHVLPGDHFFIHTQRDRLLDLVARALSAAP
jgi:medium-chain acyl-[acyl-carrier-protein] hydrolase